MGMELLEQLEQRITEILEQNTSLRQELARLQDARTQAESASFTSKNTISARAAVFWNK